ncbi:hypothetical protein O1U_0435 [Candidatus Photodesmus katoptron Akat1]|uniref:FlgN protein n=1 Tax=Candidatus Photodesmus katoptron Akat1 TaxID=1236703 RepID=S3DHQ0_9GAMM|nr:hypothetical protein O1U_0435 [Candidatus Photodesmus katoptron Akat1]
MLSDLLVYQLKNATQLAALLEKEKLAIANRNSSQIEFLAKEKIALIEQLKETDNHINSYPDISNIIKIKNFSKQIDKIYSIIRECKVLNLINGEVLERVRLSFSRLHSLIQEDNENGSIIYNSVGKKFTINTPGTDIKV